MLKAMIQPTLKSTFKPMFTSALSVALIGALASVPQMALAGDAAKGQAKSATCVACHGANGISVIPTYPNLAGQHAGYLELALKAYRDKQRTGGQAMIMAGMAAPLSDDDIANLAAYYSGL